MPDAALASAIKVEIDGQPLAGDVEPALVRVVVDDHLLLPDTFELTLQETPDVDHQRQGPSAGRRRGQDLDVGAGRGQPRACSSTAR